MVYRNSWLAGLGALAFAFAQLNNLIRPTATGVRWQYLVVAALALGIIITWTALTYRLKTWLVVLLNAGAALVAIARVAAPESTAYYLPTLTTFSRLNQHLEKALGTIRTGVEPVVPEAGVVVVIMLVIWTAGALLAWGLLRGHPSVALLPPLVLSLQFATMNRQPTAPLTIGAFIALVALVIFAVTADTRDHTSGRMAPRGEWASTRNRPGPAAAGLIGVTLLSSVFVVGAVDDLTPHDGVFSWRVDSGFPSNGYGGTLSYNPFIDTKQSLVGNTDTVAFRAGIASDIPIDEIYFRLMTLDTYDGTRFSVGSGDLVDFDDEIWESPAHRFAGPTKPLATFVAIVQLDMPWLPTVAVPYAVAAGDDVDPYLGIRTDDGAIWYPPRSDYGMIYYFDAELPQPDLNVLATNQTPNPLTGEFELSIAFQSAVDSALGSGALTPANAPTPTPATILRPEPPDAERFLSLPTDPTARMFSIGALAAAQTPGLETEFEKGLALESYLRGFEYTTDIESGHAAENLAAWLLDPESPNYQRGYCENFATAMAVMARTLGIHSRAVLGFTPGERNLREENEVIVRDRNAHAWVELWMPSQGWVRFDPTPRPDPINPSTSSIVEDRLDFAIEAFLEIELPELPSGAPTPVELHPVDLDPLPQPIGADDTAATPFSIPTWLAWAAPIVAFALALGFGVPALKRWRHRRRLHRLRRGDITAAWEDIVLRLDDLGVRFSAASTPAEVAEGVSVNMVPLADVYGKSVYGRGNGSVSTEDISISEASLLQTRDQLTENATLRNRFRATYVPTLRLRRRRKKNR